MDHRGPSAALPLRPLTIGELLDAAVSLLRGSGRVLLPIAVILAGTEQALLVSLRRWAGITPPDVLPDLDRIGAFWLVLCLGAATEVISIALLGGLAARLVGADLIGQRLPVSQLIRPRAARYPAVIAVAAVAGAVVCLAALLGPVWAAGYGLIGLAVPVLIVERANPIRALQRGIVLACRTGLQAIWIRLLGYLAWFLLRLALAFSAVALLKSIGLDRPSLMALSTAVIWVMVNAIAYPVLACLDAALYAETRIRTEGLDIVLSRARRRGTLTPDLLAAKT